MLNQEARNHMDLSRAKPVGLGDTVAAITTSAGIKPCGGCKRRQAALNKATPGWLSRILLRSSQLVDRLKARVWKR
jgi:hypothetical protein